MTTCLQISLRLPTELSANHINISALNNIQHNTLLLHSIQYESTTSSQLLDNTQYHKRKNSIVPPQHTNHQSHNNVNVDIANDICKGLKRLGCTTIYQHTVQYNKNDTQYTDITFDVYTASDIDLCLTWLYEVGVGTQFGTITLNHCIVLQHKQSTLTDTVNTLTTVQRTQLSAFIATNSQLTPNIFKSVLAAFIASTAVYNNLPILMLIAITMYTATPAAIVVTIALLSTDYDLAYHCLLKIVMSVTQCIVVVSLYTLLAISQNIPVSNMIASTATLLLSADTNWCLLQNIFITAVLTYTAVKQVLHITNIQYIYILLSAAQLPTLTLVGINLVYMLSTDDIAMKEQSIQYSIMFISQLVVQITTTILASFIVLLYYQYTKHPIANVLCSKHAYKYENVIQTKHDIKLKQLLQHAHELLLKNSS